MPDKINIIVKRPGQLPVMEEIDNTLEAMQQLVGGYIQAVPVEPIGALIVNEEGIIKNLRHNITIRVPGTVCRTQFFGTVLFAGVDGDEFTDSPLDVPQFRSVFGVVR